jgi:hypothetical protein
MEDKRELLRNGEGADVTLCVGGGEVRAHRAVLSERSIGFAALLAAHPDSERVTVTSDHVPLALFTEMIEFLYAGGATSSQWDTKDWNSLMMESLSLNIPDLTDALVRWREFPPKRNANASPPGEEERICVGWKAEGDRSPKDCLTFSFEVEGNGMQILRFYRTTSEL